MKIPPTVGVNGKPDGRSVHKRIHIFYLCLAIPRDKKLVEPRR